LSSTTANSEPLPLSNNIQTTETQFQPIAPITHMVTFNIRISRSDGTFYVRDELPNDENDKVFMGQLTLGLFGTIAPIHTQQFLQYATALTYDDDATGGKPFPSYSRSLFQLNDKENGILGGGYIPGLTLTSILSGTPAFKYMGRIIPAPLWIEDYSTSTSSSEKISHSALPHGGLISHRNLDPSPCFGITSGKGENSDSNEILDGTNTVFGQVIPTESSLQFLQRAVELPTYSNEAATNTKDDSNIEERVVENAASTVFTIQKQFFRNAAKTLGDTRIDTIYNGKILRRVEVTNLSVEKK